EKENGRKFELEKLKIEAEAESVRLRETEAVRRVQAEKERDEVIIAAGHNPMAVPLERRPGRIDVSRMLSNYASLLSSFNGEPKDLWTYLELSEKTLVANEVPKEYWGRILVAKLTGKYAEALNE